MKKSNAWVLVSIVLFSVVAAHHAATDIPPMTLDEIQVACNNQITYNIPNRACIKLGVPYNKS